MSSERIRNLITELQGTRIRDSAIIDEIERAADQTSREEDNGYEQATTADGTTIEVGSRVRIKNKVRRPATAGPTWTESKEQLATVTRFYREQIHEVTDNGTNTLRAKNNLQLVLPQTIQP